MSFQGKENPSEPSPPQPLDICTIMYTSGTSGEPKGVIWTHENMTASVTGVDHFMEEFEDKVSGNPFPRISGHLIASNINQ